MIELSNNIKYFCLIYFFYFSKIYRQITLFITLKRKFKKKNVLLRILKKFLTFIHVELRGEGGGLTLVCGYTHNRYLFVSWRIMYFFYIKTNFIFFSSDFIYKYGKKFAWIKLCSSKWINKDNIHYIQQSYREFQ